MNQVASYLFPKLIVQFGIHVVKEIYLVGECLQHLGLANERRHGLFVSGMSCAKQCPNHIIPTGLLCKAAARRGLRITWATVDGHQVGAPAQPSGSEACRYRAAHNPQDLKYIDIEQLTTLKI